MSPIALRMIGLLFLVAAAVIAILNLGRVAGLGMPWLPPILMVVGLALNVISRRRT